MKPIVLNLLSVILGAVLVLAVQNVQWGSEETAEQRKVHVPGSEERSAIRFGEGGSVLAPTKSAAAVKSENQLQAERYQYRLSPKEKNRLGRFQEEIESGVMSSTEIRERFSECFDLMIKGFSALPNPRQLNREGEDVFEAICQQDISLAVELVEDFFRYEHDGKEKIVDIGYEYFQEAANHSTELYLKAVKGSGAIGNDVVGSLKFPENFDYEKASDELWTWREEADPQYAPALWPVNLMRDWGAAEPEAALNWIVANSEKLNGNRGILERDPLLDYWSFREFFKGYRLGFADPRDRSWNPGPASGTQSGELLGSLWQSGEIPKTELLSALGTSVQQSEADESLEMLEAFARSAEIVKEE